MVVGIYLNDKYFSDDKSYAEAIGAEFGGKCRTVHGYSDLDGLDVLFVLGGDGTILTVASECARRGVKVIGINYGHLGFLAEFEPEKLLDAVKLDRKSVV